MLKGKGQWAAPACLVCTLPVLLSRRRLVRQGEVLVVMCPAIHLCFSANSTGKIPMRQEWALGSDASGDFLRAGGPAQAAGPSSSSLSLPEAQPGSWTVTATWEQSWDQGQRARARSMGQTKGAAWLLSDSTEWSQWSEAANIRPDSVECGANSELIPVLQYGASILTWGTLRVSLFFSAAGTSAPAYFNSTVNTLLHLQQSTLLLLKVS